MPRRLAVFLAVAVAGLAPLQARAAVVTTSHVKLTMRDGVRIDANVFSPAPLADLSVLGNELPVLVTQSPYRKPASPGGETEFLVNRGYVVVVTDVRGTGDSEGEWNAWGRLEHDDGAEIVRWAASQDWSTGKVGLYGTSYLGINQYLTAAQKPEGLVAMVPVQAWSDMYLDASYRGGSQGLLDSVVYGAYVTALQAAPPSTLYDGHSDDPLRDAALVWMRHVLALWTVETALEVQEHTTNDEFWKERSPSTYFREIAESGVHIMHVGGWYDLFPRAMVNNYLGVRAHPGAGAQKLVMGPWAHGNHPGAGDWSFAEQRALWFDRWLKGTPNGIDAEDPVRLWIPGADAWITSAEWPPPAFATPETIYLRGGRSGSASSLNDGLLSDTKPGQENPDTYVQEPTSGFGGGPILIRGSIPVVTEPQDQRLEEPKMLTYSSQPFEAPVDVIGPVSLVLYAASTAEDTDFVARLGRVRTDGSVELLTRGWLRASHRLSHENPEPISPGEIVRYEIEIWPTARRFAPGERLRLDISSADFPLQVPMAQVAQNSVYHDEAHMSALQLSIVAAR